MCELEIPKSDWVLKKVYFKAKLVSNFPDHYIKLLKKEDNLLKPDAVCDLFLKRMMDDETVELYQFPNASRDGHYDYFEKEDDNHVIPRSLFELVVWVDKVDDSLKWFVIWCPRVSGWAVKQGGFQDSWDRSKYISEQRRDFLNKHDKTENNFV